MVVSWEKRVKDSRIQELKCLFSNEFIEVKAISSFLGNVAALKPFPPQTDFSLESFPPNCMAD